MALDVTINFFNVHNQTIYAKIYVFLKCFKISANGIIFEQTHIYTRYWNEDTKRACRYFYLLNIGSERHNIWFIVISTYFVHYN